MEWRFPVVVLFVILFLFVVLQIDQNPITNISKTQTDDPIGNRIIRIIHQSWKDNNLPKQFRNYSKSWTDVCFREWSYKLWTDEDNLNLVKKYYPSFLSKYLSFPRPIYRADVARYMYMYQFGGIYTDLDNECLAPFEHLLRNYSIVFGAMEGQFADTNLKEGYVQNSFFYSVPRHDFWKELLEAISLNANFNIPEIQTGPVLLSKFIESFRKRYPDHGTIRVYEPIYFNPFSWMGGKYNNKHCKDKGRMSEEDWLACRSSMRAMGAYVVQYHAHFWN